MSGPLFFDQINHLTLFFLLHISLKKMCFKLTTLIITCKHTIHSYAMPFLALGWAGKASKPIHLLTKMLHSNPFSCEMTPTAIQRRHFLSKLKPIVAVQISACLIRGQEAGVLVWREVLAKKPKR